MSNGIDKPLYISFKKRFPSLYKVVPGLIPGVYHAITGGTGTGKTKIAKEIFVNFSYQYAEENDIDLHILYFALEESKEKFWLSIESDLLLKKFNVNIKYYQLKGYHPGYTDEIKEYRQQIKPIIDKMKNRITVIDDKGTPAEIHNYIKKFMKTVGTYQNETKTRDEDGNIEISYEFKYNKSNTIVQLVVDHYSLLGLDLDTKDLMSSMSKFSRRVMVEYTKRLRLSVCAIHQQEMAGDNTENMKLGNLKPTLSKLGDNKMIGRDYYVLLGIFNPQRYEQFRDKIYGAYDLKLIGDNFRHLTVIKHRDGKANVGIPIYFDGASNYIAELPSQKDKDFEVIMEEYYERVRKNEKESDLMFE